MPHDFDVFNFDCTLRCHHRLHLHRLLGQRHDWTSCHIHNIYIWISNPQGLAARRSRSGKRKLSWTSPIVSRTERFQEVLGDTIVIWRAWAVWNRSYTAILAPFLFWVATIGKLICIGTLFNILIVSRLSIGHRFCLLLVETDGLSERGILYWWQCRNLGHLVSDVHLLDKPMHNWHNWLSISVMLSP